jgi:hypothetical protein
VLYCPSFSKPPASECTPTRWFQPIFDLSRITFGDARVYFIWVCIVIFLSCPVRLAIDARHRSILDPQRRSCQRRRQIATPRVPCLWEDARQEQAQRCALHVCTAACPASLAATVRGGYIGTIRATHPVTGSLMAQSGFPPLAGTSAVPYTIIPLSLFRPYRCSNLTLTQLQYFHHAHQVRLFTPSPGFRRRTPSLPQGSLEAEVPPLAAPSSFGSSFGSVDDLRSHVCLT